MVIIQGEESNLELDFPDLPNRSTSSKEINIFPSVSTPAAAREPSSKEPTSESTASSGVHMTAPAASQVLFWFY